MFVVAWAVLLLSAGALVTSEDAALAVPDWPLSYGSITPPMVGGIAFEHTHRVIAAILGLFIIILSVMLWRKEERPWVKWLGVAAVAGVIIQGLLGGLTVLKLLHYWLPVMHACMAQLMFAALVTIAVVTSRWWVANQPQFEDKATPAIHTIVVLNAGAIFLQIALGAAFRTITLQSRRTWLGPWVFCGLPPGPRVNCASVLRVRGKFPASARSFTAS